MVIMVGVLQESIHFVEVSRKKKNYVFGNNIFSPFHLCRILSISDSHITGLFWSDFKVTVPPFQVHLCKLPLRAAWRDHGSGPGPAISTAFGWVHFSFGWGDMYFLNDASMLSQNTALRSFELFLSSSMLSHCHSAKQINTQGSVLHLTYFKGNYL